MPVTRSGGPSRHPRAASIPHGRSRRTASSSFEAAEVIPISSASGSSSSSASTSNTFFTMPPAGGSVSHAPRPKRKANIVPQEVIEISSDEDDEPPRRQTSVAPTNHSNNALAELRNEVRKLKEDKEQLRREAQTLHHQLEVQRHKVRTLEIQSSSTNDKVPMDENELDDITSCNVCTNTMFVPYIIGECGHTFCQKCLTDWFDTILRNFLAAHPLYNPNAPIPIQVLHAMTIPNAHRDPRVQAYIQANTPPQPQYTCPQCRTPVKSAPIENFGMKSLARMVAVAKKEAIPPAPPRPRNPIWEGYFPVRRLI